MKLADWMEKQKIDDEAFGAMVDAHRVTISRIRRGINQPSWDLAGRITEATKGKVTASDFVNSMSAEAAE